MFLSQGILSIELAVRFMDHSIRACAFKSNDGYSSYAKYYLCHFEEFCCSQGCCSHARSPFTFYQLWYFWLLLLLIVLVCSGSGWWFRWRHAGGLLGSPTGVTIRRRHQRHRVYPRYNHNLDTDPPTYAEVMRRQSEFPVPVHLDNPNYPSHPDTNWISSPPPPYEAIKDLRDQQQKIAEEIKLEERSSAISIPSSTDPPSRRPRFSARERIRNLLGRPVAQSTINDRVEENNDMPPPYTISSVDLQNSNNGLQSPITRSEEMKPPHRSGPSYPVMFNPPFIRNASNINADVDEWSEVDLRRSSISTISRPQTAINMAYGPTVPSSVPGDLSNSLNERNQIQNTVNSTRRPATVGTAHRPQRSILNSTNYNIRINSPQNSNASSVESDYCAASLTSEPVHHPLLDPNAVITEQVQSSQPISSISGSLGVGRSVSRPVSSTTMLTPGNMGDGLNLPGILRSQFTEDSSQIIPSAPALELLNL